MPVVRLGSTGGHTGAKRIGMQLQRPKQHHVSLDNRRHDWHNPLQLASLSIANEQRPGGIVRDKSYGVKS